VYLDDARAFFSTYIARGHDRGTSETNDVGHGSDRRSDLRVDFRGVFLDRKQDRKAWCWIGTDNLAYSSSGSGSSGEQFGQRGTISRIVSLRSGTNISQVAQYPFRC